MLNLYEIQKTNYTFATLKIDSLAGYELKPLIRHGPGVQSGVWRIPIAIGR
jgi:hypothetical protein